MLPPSCFFLEAFRRVVSILCLENKTGEKHQGFVSVCLFPKWVMSRDSRAILFEKVLGSCLTGTN